LKFFADKSREEDLRAGIIQDAGDAELNDYRKDFSPSYLVEMFGLETVKGILEFFHESVGSKVPGVRSYVRRSFKEGPQDMHIPYHIEGDRSVMILPLSGDGDYEGGELIYLNHQGPHHVAHTPGKAIVLNAKDVHGVAAHTGTRYTLFIWGMTEAECILLEGCSLQEALEDFDPTTRTQPN
jgi:hypothetical protein